jgi:hypothetical protein
LTFKVVQYILQKYNLKMDVLMTATAKGLSRTLKELPEVVSRDEEVAITLRGSRVAYEKTDKPIIGGTKHDLFGIWADREDIKSVDDYVRKMRS